MVVKIPLSKRGIHAGKYEALVSDEDGDLATFNWSRITSEYAQRIKRVKGIDTRFLLHRVVMERKLGSLIPDGMEVDHINNNRLDCRRENLRLANGKQNRANRPAQKNNTSGYKGVGWAKRHKKWEAHIRVNGKAINLGYFNDIEDAHKAYCEAADKYFGEFANYG